MKKIAIFFLVLMAFASQNKLQAQITDPDQVDFTVILNGVFDLNVPFGDVQQAIFMTAAHYNTGVFEPVGNGINPGYSQITIDATGDWELTVQADDFDDGAGQTIPANNLGVWIEDEGFHANGAEVTYTCIAIGTSQGITNSFVPLIGLGPAAGGNMGSYLDNAFRLHWRMGTMDGTMEPTSMFFQMSNGDFGLGTYTGTVNLLLTEL